MSKTLKTRRAVLTTLGAVAVSTGSAYAGRPSPSQKAIEVKVFPTFAAIKADSTIPTGTIIETLGYFYPGDTGAAAYKITGTAEGAHTEPLPDGRFASLLHNGYVNYKMFGAVSDGRSDDGANIKKAHLYANDHRIPVINLYGEYWLKNTRKIPVQTNTNWGNTVFHLDETKNIPGEPHFHILPDKPAREITFQPSQKVVLLEKLRPGSKFIPELAEHKNCLVVVKDENDRIGRRYGPDYNPKGWAREDFFYVEEHGRIIGDIAWTFRDYTHLTAYPCAENYLTIEGGTFLLSGDNPGKIGGPYHHLGLSVLRSRTIIRNQWVGLENGAEDVSLTPRSGFYNFSHVYDVLLENIRLIPWEKNRSEAEKALKAGTYGIGGSRVLCGTFRNITAEGGPVHWGVFGTNLFKNFRIEGCRLNRVDVHFHGWNIVIRDSEIGQKGLTLTGGGELLIENTRVFHHQFVNFRQDYGAKWDGSIRIINCKAVLQSPANATILSMRPGVFDYRYPVVLGHRILVKDFAFVSSTAWNSSEYSLIQFPDFSVSEEGGRIAFPGYIAFENIVVEGRERGLQSIHLPDISGFYVQNQKGGEINGVVEPNCLIQLKNLHFDSDSDTPNLRLDLTRPYLDSYSLYPSLYIDNCTRLNAWFGNVAASITVKDTLINQFTAGKDQDFKGRISFDNCRFQATIPDKENTAVFRIKAPTGISFTNCEINLPIKDDITVAEALRMIDFLSLDGRVRHNHLNTRLGPDVLSALSQKQIKLTKGFIQKLKIHHELED